jgi:hypothetical protein
MQRWGYSNDRGWTVFEYSQAACPKCGGPACRVPRRPVDRLMSLILPQHRYKCESPDCRWEGNLRAGSE